MKKLQKLLLLACSMLLTACSSARYIDVTSTNQNSRVNFLVIHATSGNFAESLRLLSTRNPNPVSAHYLLPYLDDPTYSPNRLSIYRLVDENRRAWHAGISQWGNESSLNNRSIGIEVVNDFDCNDLSIKPEEESIIELDCTFPSYPPSQIESLVSLIKEILDRHPAIDPIDIVAHADIAPSRKSDPGPRFPWRELYEAGIGPWYDTATVNKYSMEFTGLQPSIQEAQCALSIYGYPIIISGTHDLQSQFAFRAFQLHYRPSNYSGLLDQETLAILYALNEKYRDTSRATCNRNNEV